MAVDKDELIEWLENLPKCMIGIDDGGLTLVATDTPSREDHDYFEIGGIPEDEELEGSDA